MTRKSHTKQVLAQYNEELKTIGGCPEFGCIINFAMGPTDAPPCECAKDTGKVMRLAAAARRLAFHVDLIAHPKQRLTKTNVVRK